MVARVEGPAPAATGRGFDLGLPFRSLVSKLVLLLIIFCAVPVILYTQFREADAEKRFLLMESVREQGRVVAESLRPLLEQQEVSSLPLLNDEVARFANQQTGVKILFRPTGEYGAESFFFVASQPTIAPTELAEERDRLVERGVFDNLAQSCWGELSMALRHRRPSGEEELLTSITPINTDAGCWAVITTHSTAEFLGTSIDQPYWKTIEVRIAAAIYFAMAIFTIGLFVSIWRGLMRFRYLARSIRTGKSGHVSFGKQNRVPELAPVAEEFDRMTLALQDSAESIRLAAEDNAHAFKTPIAIMRQSLEPLRRLVAPDEVRGQRALDVLEVSIDRLDHLVAYARRLEETTAELLDPPRQRIVLTEMVERMLAAYADTFASRRLILDARLQEDVSVLAGEDLLETVLENVIDNAVEVSPHGSKIIVELRRVNDRAELSLLDRGPGVPHGELTRIFERYVSLRSKPAGDPEQDGGEGNPHMGIGLWIVRRNLQAIGGSVRAENRPDGGLAMVMRFPLAA